jgi:hypothetical protein
MCFRKSIIILDRKSGVYGNNSRELFGDKKIIFFKKEI